MASTNPTEAGALAGKYLTFVLGREEYGLEILKVREIMGIVEITGMPQLPAYVKGVINLRGTVIPIVDLRLKFGLLEAEYTKETCIIVVHLGESLIGIVVDTVSEVINIAEKEIDPPPSFGGTITADYIVGMGKVKGSVKILLDINGVLRTESGLPSQIINAEEILAATAA